MKFWVFRCTLVILMETIGGQSFLKLPIRTNKKKTKRRSLEKYVSTLNIVNILAAILTILILTLKTKKIYFLLVLDMRLSNEAYVKKLRD